MGNYLDVKLLTYLFGLGPITVLFFLKTRNKSRVLNCFFIGYTLFNIEGIAGAVIDITNFNNLYFLIITLLIHYISIYFFIISVLYLIDNRNFKKVRIVYLAITLLLYSSFLFYIINFEMNEINNNFSNLISSMLLFLNFCILWIQPILLILNIKKFSGTKRKMIKGIIISTFIFLVVVFMENYISILFPSYHSGFFEIPGLFILNISIIYLSIKYGFVKNDKSDLKLSLKELELTNREMDICRLLYNNLSYKEIANQLNISVDTVKTHASNIYKKNGFKARKDLQKYFI